jgi:hypothetical protein
MGPAHFKRVEAHTFFEIISISLILSRNNVKALQYILCQEDREWIKDTMTTEDNPYIQVIVVLKG